MSQASSASDLGKIALASLQAGAARAEPRPTGNFARIELLQLFALLCVVTALGCALVALWIYSAPMLGAAGALLVNTAVLCAVGFAVFVFELRTRELRARSPAPSIDADALLAEGSGFFRRHTALTLIAALLGGVFLRRRKLDPAASPSPQPHRRGMSSFRGCSWRPAVRIMASDTSILQPRGGEVIR